MKKVLLSIISLMLISLFMMGITVYAAPGDANNDGELTIMDALLIVKAVANGTSLENADVNGDGKTNLLDILGVIKLIATGDAPEVGEEEKSTADIVVENGTVKEAVSISGEKVSAAVPEGVAVEDGATELTLSVTALDSANGNKPRILEKLQIHNMCKNILTADGKALSYRLTTSTSANWNAYYVYNTSTANAKLGSWEARSLRYK